MAKIDLMVIDQMYAAQMSMNESEETINALRPQAEEAVKDLPNGKKTMKSYLWSLELAAYDEEHS